ncbi:D-alanine--D-alanine ligase [Pseudonocardiaceae bacterium YIM PH 21723]|nr:D-alanine--D-alanine ligase [Pseudonocardiaceae bacterium YIM PH 21723]
MSDRWIAVLAGGLSHERDVSLRSGRRLAVALKETGLTVEVWDPDAALLSKLEDHKPDAVVVALHGGEGENGAVQSILELLHVPFVGSSSRACRLAWDKPAAKAELKAAGLSTPDSVVLPHNTFRELGAQNVLAALVKQLGLPLMLKPHEGGSALGAKVVHREEDLPHAMMDVLAYGDTVLAEKYISGVEVAVSVVEGPDGPRALPSVEVVPQGGVYDYTARYTAGLTDYHSPARLTPEQERQVGELAVTAHRVLGLRDVSRTDAIVTPDGTPYFLEVNVSPGLTETSLLPSAVETAGGDLGEIYSGLIDRAIARG